jgi:hypothetical protein
MKPKEEKRLMHKLVCLSNLFLENVDELQPTTPRMKQLQKDLIEFCELLNNEINDTATMQKSTYFHEISNKIDTILRKNFDENM